MKEQSEKFLEIFDRSGIDIADMMEKVCQSLLTEAVDSAAELFLKNALPEIRLALDVRTFFTNFANLFCLYQDLDSVSKTESILVEVCDWREIYAGILEESDKDGIFSLGYINRDSVPELIIRRGFSHFGSAAEIYSLQNRKVRQVADSSGNTDITIAYGVLVYAEAQDVLVRGNGMHMGITTTGYEEIQDYGLHCVHSFVDDENATDPPNTYTYNHNDVSKAYYYYMLNKLNKQYEDSLVRIDGGEGCYEMSEENIAALRRGDGIEVIVAGD